MKALIIGCGRVGGEISKKLLKKSYIKKIILFDKFEETSKKLLISLKSNKVSMISSLEEINKVDYIILSISAMSHEQRIKIFNTMSNTYEMRQGELNVNISALREIIPKLNNILVSKSIIVISNPIEEIVYYLNNSLKDKIILGFGLKLDIARYTKNLGKKVMCFGEHGRVIPLLNLNSREDYKKIHNKLDSQVLEFIKIHGMTHKKTALEFSKNFDKLNSIHESTVFFAKFIKEEVFGVKNFVTSLPFQAKDGIILHVSNISPSKLELELFKEQSKMLKEHCERLIS